MPFVILGIALLASAFSVKNKVQGNDVQAPKVYLGQNHMAGLHSLQGFPLANQGTFAEKQNCERIDDPTCPVRQVP